MPHLADIYNIRALSHKGSCNEVDVIDQSPLGQILLVLFGQGGQVHDHSGQIYVLTLPGHKSCQVYAGPHRLHTLISHKMLHDT